MGETGIGKTALVQLLSEIMKVEQNIQSQSNYYSTCEIITKTIHAGVNINEILEFLK